MLSQLDERVTQRLWDRVLPETGTRAGGVDAETMASSSGLRAGLATEGEEDHPSASLLQLILEDRHRLVRTIKALEERTADLEVMFSVVW